MATIPLRTFNVAKTIHGNSPWTLTFPEAASQTFKLGALVALDSAGNIAECGADPTGILGVVAADASGTTGADVTVWIADDETVFVGNLSGTSTSDRRDVGKDFGVVKTGNNWLIDKTDLANRRVVIVDLDRRDAVGDTNAREHFVFFSQFRQLSSTS